MTWLADFSSLINNMFAQVLEKAKTRQVGRASEKIAIANFTEGWFKNSGLYDINESYQEKLMDNFIVEHSTVSLSAVTSGVCSVS